MTLPSSSLSSEKEGPFPLATSVPNSDKRPDDDTKVEKKLEIGEATDEENEGGQTWTKGEVQDPGFRDVYFAIAFVINVFIVGILAFILGGKALTFEEILPPEALFPVVVILSIMSTLLLSVAALGAMFKHAILFIKISLFVSIGIFTLMTFVYLLTFPPAAIITCLCMTLLACYTMRVWNRIPYAASNLRSAITAIQANMGIALVAFSTIPVHSVWLALWFFAFVGTTQTDLFQAQEQHSVDGSEDTISPIGYMIVLLFLLSYYWTAQVIMNTTLTTISGVVGTWWFNPLEASSFCSRAIRDSFVRSTTYSFGSICFGSLIVAILQVIENVLRNARNNRRGGILTCIAHCLLFYIERLVEYFNKWAFVYVGLYGYSYMDAGKKVMSLFKDRGWSAIIADNLVNRLLGIASLAVGLAMLPITAFVSFIMGASSFYIHAAMLIGFVIGVMLCSIMMGVLSSSVDAIIVCYAEAPEEFERNHPILHDEMKSAWMEAWPTVDLEPMVATPLMGGVASSGGGRGQHAPLPTAEYV